jgi:hypothetical protein
MDAMNKITQYRPAFFEGYENATVEFKSAEELLNIPWVANFANRPDFHKFSVSDEHLMAEYRGGREWWVVGLLDKPVAELPKWDRGISECVEGDVPGALVAWSCGEEVGLKDGRVFRRKAE